jgi:ATP synthase protein I
MASIDARVLRSAIPASVAVGAAGTVIGLLVAGASGVWAGLIGTAIVIAFFSVGQGVLGYVLRNNPQIALSVALLIYLARVGVLFILLIIFQGTTFFNNQVFAGTIVACTLTWTFVEVFVFARSKVLTIEPGSGPNQ